MLTTTRLLTLSSFCGVALLALSACDPCAADPALCIPGAPDSGATEGEMPGLDTGDDQGATDGSGAPEPGADDGMTPEPGTQDTGATAGDGEDDGDGDDGDRGDEGGESGGEATEGGDTKDGDGEDGSGESGTSERDPDVLACWAGFDDCLQSGGSELACILELRVCMLDAASGIPDGACLESIAGCLIAGGDVLACLDDAGACVDPG